MSTIIREEKASQKREGNSKIFFLMNLFMDLSTLLETFFLIES